jgi:hypothetical protein
MTAPRITMQDLEANIAHERTFTAGDGVFGQEVAMCGTPVTNLKPLNRLTLCVIVTKCGYTVVGTNHGSVADENFDAALGRKYARENAIEQLWSPMGYALKQKLYEGA